MILFCFALLCGLAQGQVVPVENDSPTFYIPGDCTHPVEAVAGHKKPISDGEITITLFTADNDTDQRVEIWAPETDYRIVVTSEVKIDLLVGVNGGELSNDDEGAEDCGGAMWYTTARDTEHTVTWKTPACCEFGGTNVQIFVTGSKHDDDYLRQQELFVEADQSKCSCAGGTTPPKPSVTQLPEEVASAASGGGTHFTDAEEEPVSSPGGEIDPNTLSAEVEPVVSTKASEDKPSSSFGYAFLIMLLTICIALGAVWFYRKYRVRQMQYREFEGLEMRGYAQWSDAAGL